MSVQETKLKAIADAIRAKDGTTEPIPANDFADRILALETGGSLPDNVRTISLTADPPEGGTVSGGLSEENLRWDTDSMLGKRAARRSAKVKNMNLKLRKNGR